MFAGGTARKMTALSLAALVPSGGALVDEHSASAPVQLPAPAAVGQGTTTEAVIETTVDGGPVSLHLVTTSLVTAVRPNGAYTARSVIDSLEVTNAPASADVSSWGFRELQGATFNRTYASTGRPLNLATRSVGEQALVLDAVSMAYVGFPTEPIRVGDSWTVEGRIASGGWTYDVAYHCRLAAVLDGSYSVDISYVDGFSYAVDNGSAEGTISGTGTLSGSLENPLVVSGRLNQTIDGIVTVDDSATPMRTDTSITLTEAG